MRPLLRTVHRRFWIRRLRLLLITPIAVRLLYLKGLAHAHLGQHALALRAYESAQTAGFLTPFVLFNGANACRALGNIDDGIRLYREAISLNPRFSEARNNLAMAYIDAGQPEAAERELRLLLRDQPSWYQAAFTLANLLRDNKRYLEAIEAFVFVWSTHLFMPKLGTTSA